MHPISSQRAAAAASMLSLALMLGAAGVHAADMPRDVSRTADVGPELAAARRAVKAEDWPAAIRQLERANAKDSRQPEVHTLLGYAFRKSGQLDQAFIAYEAALKLDPRHQGAHEYIGEAYLMARQPDKAREHLATLKSLCGERCEPYQDLAKAIAAYRP